MTTDGAAAPQLSRSAKFSIPSRPPDLLRRPRLLNFLHENIHRKLILISAAAGYGKSSLLADLALDTDYSVAWCHLDASDRDLAALAVDLVWALQHTFPSFQSLIPALVAQGSANPTELAAALDREIDGALTDYFVLILDDFHLVDESAPVMRFFDALLANFPDQAHLVIGGRTIPPLQIAPLAARQQIAGLSEEHLRFTAAEVQQLLRLRNLVSLPDAEAEKLVGDTEGWITGILLTTHLMWQGLMASLVQARQSEGPLYDYLAQEVLHQQPDVLRQFLLESAVLPEMEAAVCDEVLGRSDSAEMLRQAEAHRLFVSTVGTEFPAYQYHHLFRDFLLAELRAKDPERLDRLSVRAAEWYAANGMAEAAVTYYVMASHLGRAAQVAEDHAQGMFVAGRYATLRQWAEQLLSVAGEVPRLYLYLAKVDTDRGELTAAEAELETAAQGCARSAGRALGVQVDLQRCLVSYRRGHFDRALALAQTAGQEARELNEAASAAMALRFAGLCQFALGQPAVAEQSLQAAIERMQSPQRRYDLAGGLNDLALVLRACGQTARAARALQQALAIWREPPVPGPLATVLNNIGYDLHMLGQYEAALATYSDALEWARRAGSARSEVVIMAGQGDVFADVGDRSSAAELYRLAMAKAEPVGDAALTAYLCRAIARLDRWAGNYSGALEWLRRAALASRMGQRAAHANQESLRGMTLVEMGDVREGRHLLDQVCSDLEQSGVLVDLAQALFFRACAEFRDADLDAAAASLAGALKVVDQVGYDQMLVSEALAAFDLLEACRARPDLGPRAGGLLERARALSEVRERLGRSREMVAAARPPPGPSAHVALEVRALGQSRVLKGGVEIPRSAWTSQRTRELFLFLVDRAPILRDEVLATFWPEKDLARGLANLYQTLYRMRRAVGYDVVILEDQECRWAPDADLAYDVARFESEARAALAVPAGELRRLGMLVSAVQCYTGDYLADLTVEWSGSRRQALSDLYVDLLRTYADELMNLTRYGEAREALGRALAVEPLRDDLHQRMLVCLAALGRRHQVVDHYRRYRETLRSELGLEPPAEIRALYSRLIE